MNEYHGDEPEIEENQRQLKEDYDIEHGEDWKYEDQNIALL